MNICDVQISSETIFIPVILVAHRNPFMSHTSLLFPSCVKNQLFKTDRGDVCLCLHEVWPSLLTDLGLLGPAILIPRSEQMALVSRCREFNFVPVPGGTEMLDLNSGLCLETLGLGAAIASQEAQTGNLCFHFFNLERTGLFKILLPPEADLDGFSHLVRHYAKGPSWSDSQLSPSPRALGEGAISVEDRIKIQKAWDSFDPVLGGDALPGGECISWWDALCLAGPGKAMTVSKVDLIKAILAAHHDRLQLRMIATHAGLHYETTLVPRRLERCRNCFHLFDVEKEAHFFFESPFEAWVGFHGKARTATIHIFSSKRQRRGVIQLAGKHQEGESWNRALSAGTLFREE